ncbi:RFC3 [Scenedesmus sp. PABB004]|nr:RFC3 [Scenedesmus sp. PABB004]
MAPGGGPEPMQTDPAPAPAAPSKARVDRLTEGRGAPWVEKYRPKSLDDVAAHKEIIDTSARPRAPRRCRACHGARGGAAARRGGAAAPTAAPHTAVKKLTSENRLPHLLLYGPPGTGKTSTILAVARSMYGAALPNMTLELNASDDRGIDVVRQQIQDFASTRSVFSTKFKLVILDECDAMTRDAQFALRRVIEKYTRNTRFCLICNYVSKIIPALQSRCTRFRFPPLDEDNVRDRLQHVVDAEGVNMGPGGMDALIRLGCGDMRRTLNILQSAHMACEVVDETSVYLTTGNPLPSDIEAVINWLLNEPFVTAFQSIAKLQVDRGVALVDIVRELHPWMFSIDALPPRVRITLVDKLADIEHRLAYGCSEALQLGALVAAFALVRDEIVAAAAAAIMGGQRRGGAGYYDDDDLDDDWDDDEEDEWDEPVTGAGAKGAHGHAKPKAAPHAKPNAPAAAAAAVAHVANIQHRGAAYPLSPAAQQPGFDFASPSPDDRAKAAGPAGRPTVGIPLAPSRTPTVKQQQQAAQARKQQGGDGGSGSGGGIALASQHSIDAALHDLDGLHLASDSASASGDGLGGGGDGKRARGGAGGPTVPWRPLREYQLEPELARDVDAALAAEAASDAGRRGLHLVVMGHVDAGKSTLMGRLLHELGHVSSKEVHKNQKDAAAAGKASFSWAWVLDERPEERARGVTVDVALARFVTPGHDVTLLDAPGHRDFVPNMIAGAGLADAALLLVDGSPGGFEAGFYGEGAGGAGGGGFGEAPPGGQTQEHAQLARSLGVEQLAVVVSKLDTCEYSQERFEYIRGQLLPFLKSVGFRDAAVQWLPAVGPAGQNLVSPPTAPQLAAWWRGPTLVQAIDAFRPKPRNAGAPLRVPVQDVGKPRQGGGVVVGGKLEGGALRPGSRVLVVPGFETAVVKSLDVNGQDHAPLALAGDSADVVLTGVDAAALHAGAVLCHPRFPVHLAARFTVQVLVLPVPLPILKGHAVTIHAHTAREAGVISSLLGLCDAKSGAARARKPRCLLGGQTALVEVTPVRPLPLELFADVKALGRVALREGGRTVAVGVVTGIDVE